MANFIYNSARQLFAEGKIDWSFVTGTPRTTPFTDYKIMAAMVNTTGGVGMQNYVVATAVPNVNSDSVRYVPNVSRNMNSEFGYGQTLANSSLIRTGGGTVITAELTGRGFVGATAACTASDITFSAVPVSAAYTNIEAMVIYLQPLDGGAQADGSNWPVIAFIDTLGTGSMNITPNGGDIVCQWNVSGIFRL